MPTCAVVASARSPSRCSPSALHAGGVHRVQASTDVANIAEQRSLERAGFVREGVARGSQVRADGRHDLVLYSCLPGEPAFIPQ